jgi:hypothetical protein
MSKILNTILSAARSFSSLKNTKYFAATMSQEKSSNIMESAESAFNR